ncbi:hypothetical protein [Vibrio sp. CAU 1672]|uniref:hypothetical protein n=1 Tax=Vibrio sp. CAU 1672 TaxID=3032594 RepID=UPI0023D9D470|nr:hypothetical protein [Vibrio sp. CAU 1672]MDF2155027.1 hypothetical protein [Vibrio sp. CAU 1672]
MEEQERQFALQTITQRLVIFTGSVLLLIALGLYVGLTQRTDNLYAEPHCLIEKSVEPDRYLLDCSQNPGKPQTQERSYLVLLVFAAGLLGGFVSIQQRLPKISAKELSVLSSSWISVTLIPINGGIFALVLMLSFVGGIIQGELFPVYHDLNIANADDFSEWLKRGYPVSGTDVGKLLFWSFVSGFTERFVPQIIRKTSESGAGNS